MWWWLIWKSFHFTEALQKTDVCCATDWYKLTLMLSQSLTHPASDCMHLENKQLLYESIITSAWLQNWSWTPTFLTGKDLIPFDYLAALWTSWSFSGNLSNFSSFFFASCMERDIVVVVMKDQYLYGDVTAWRAVLGSVLFPVTICCPPALLQLQWSNSFLITAVKHWFEFLYDRLSYSVCTVNASLLIVRLIQLFSVLLSSC